MSIKPNIVILQESDNSINALNSVYIGDIPEKTLDPVDYDADYIDKIRTQPLLNDIEKQTLSPFKQDIQQMVQLLGAYCKTNSMDEIKNIITQIHSTLPSKPVANVKNWVRLLTGIHPQIDQFIKSLAYWKPYSEIIGTNTIMYYADTSTIDITMWSNSPLFVDNRIVWFTDPWKSPSYLRESLREKLDSDVVEYIQNAGRTTTKLIYRNIAYEAHITTRKVDGAEVEQERPVDPAITHGVGLNNDWYNQYFRIMPSNKPLAKSDAITYLDRGGVFVHVLVNHLQPLFADSRAEVRSIEYRKPLGVEETFPRAVENTIITDKSGNVILPNTTVIDNEVLEPEKA